MRLSESAKQAIAALLLSAILLGGAFMMCVLIEKAHPVPTVPAAEPCTEMQVAVSTAIEIIEAKTAELTEVEEETATLIVPKLASDADIELIARTIWGEAGYIESQAEQAAVAWCILNRVDAYENLSIEQVITTPFQFFYENGGTKPVPDRYIALAKDVVARWELEHAGQTDVGRTLPADYQFFIGDGEHNFFTTEWRGTDFWDWSLPSPYPEDMQ